MKGSLSYYRRNCRLATPLLLLALSACSSTPPPASLLVDSELGRPLANTQRSGDDVADRQRVQARIEKAPNPPHRISSPARAAASPAGSAATRNPLGD